MHCGVWAYVGYVYVFVSARIQLCVCVCVCVCTCVFLEAQLCDNDITRDMHV